MPRNRASAKAVPSQKGYGPASYFPSIEKTYGQPIAYWKALIRAHLPAKHMELVGWLKREHQMGHGHANALVGHTLAEGEAPASKKWLTSRMRADAIIARLRARLG
jgi:hypothetical protein